MTKYFGRKYVEVDADFLAPDGAAPYLQRDSALVPSTRTELNGEPEQSRMDVQEMFGTNMRRCRLAAESNASHTTPQNLAR